MNWATDDPILAELFPEPRIADFYPWVAVRVHDRFIGHTGGEPEGNSIEIAYIDKTGAHVLDLPYEYLIRDNTLLAIYVDVPCMFADTLVRSTKIPEWLNG